MVPLLLLFLAQQSHQKPAVANPKEPIETRLSKIEKELKDIESLLLENVGYYASRTSVDVLEIKVALLEELIDKHASRLTERIERNDVVELDAADSGYSQLRASNGVLLLVSLDLIEPYLDGYKAHIRVGNTSSFTLAGIDFDVVWGKDLKSPHHRKTSSPLNFYGGSWVPVELVIPEAKPGDVKQIRLSASCSRVSAK